MRDVFREGNLYCVKPLWFNLLIGATLLLDISTAALWVRSEFVADDLCLVKSNTSRLSASTFVVMSYRGIFLIGVDSLRFDAALVRGDIDDPAGAAGMAPTSPSANARPVHSLWLRPACHTGALP